MPNKYSHIIFNHRLTIYYRTENGHKYPSNNNKAWLMFYFNGEMYGEDGDITVKEFYQIRELCNTNINTTKKYKDSNSLAMRLTMQKLNNEDRWYVFKDIRELDTLKRIIDQFFRKGEVRDECRKVRHKLVEIEEQLEKEEREKWLKKMG